MNKNRKLSAAVYFLWWALAVFFCAFPAWAAQGYEKPPAEVQAVLNAPQPPTLFLSPTRDTMLFAGLVRYPPITDLAAPMLPLAGVRVNPLTNAECSNIYYWTSLVLKKLPGGAETPVTLPPEARRIGNIRWNAAGTMVAFTSETSGGVGLWVLDAAKGKVQGREGLRVNPVLGCPVQWMPDQETLLVKLVPPGRGKPPAAPAVPPGPRIQASSGVTVASSTYEARDVLKNPHDEDLFDYYGQSTLALVNARSGAVTEIGKPALYDRVSPAPGGSHILVERLHRPYSYLCACNRFPRVWEVWNTRGEVVDCLERKPLAEQIPIDGVVTGPRDFSWRPTRPATLTWIEALDGGNPKTKVPYRDRVMQKPVGGTARELWKSEYRCTGLAWVEKGDLVFASEFDRSRRWNRVFLLQADTPGSEPRPVWSLSADEKYNAPGWFIYRTLPTGAGAVMERDGCVYLASYGATPEGERPFLDRLDLATLKTERLFRSDRTCFEFFTAWVNPGEGTFITRRESPTEPPNYYLRTLAGAPVADTASGEASWPSGARAITSFSNPTPGLSGITRRLITYQRADGVSLSCMLYLPPGYAPGTRLPTVLWAYPIDYAEKGVAGQVSGSSNRFITFNGASVLFFLLRGYAVLDHAAMPVVGPPENAYDTFAEQITDNAKAAIDKAVELGVTDPERVGVAGHSHGALMTANLLVYSDLFRAGIACSGAYNHTIRPFGFQNERRTYWQARDSYVKISPVLQADRLNKPLLLIHGEVDQNPGTVSMQSEKFYEALRGVGGTVRLVMLPHESHGYIGRESVEHVLYEMLSWFDRYVKNAPPRQGKQSPAK